MRSALSFALVLLITGSAAAVDWPQWMGPNRDGRWTETGVIREMPKELSIKWRIPAGYGYAGPAVAKGRVYLFDYVLESGEPSGNQVTLTGKERLRSLDADTGEVVWTHEYDRPYGIAYGYGPRCTPTVDDDRVYTLGAEGDLKCLKVADGSVVWHKNFKDEYGAETPMWGHASHPLVDEDTVYCLVGGEGSAVVAFDKMTGAEKWKALSAPDAGYSPASMIEQAGTKQLIVWTPLEVASLNPQTGEVYWQEELKPAFGMSIMAPQKEGDLLFASGAGTTGGLFRLDADKPGAELVWRGKTKESIYAVNATPLIEDGVIYGCDGESSALIAARLEDGERLWETKEPTINNREGRIRIGTAFIVKNGDRHFLFNETGDLILAKLTPEKYEEFGRVHLLEPTSMAFGREVVWSHPAFAQKCVFARNDKEIVCASLAE